MLIPHSTHTQMAATRRLHSSFHLYDFFSVVRIRLCGSADTLRAYSSMMHTMHMVTIHIQIEVKVNGDDGGGGGGAGDEKNDKKY